VLGWSTYNPRLPSFQKTDLLERPFSKNIHSTITYFSALSQFSKNMSGLHHKDYLALPPQTTFTPKSHDNGLVGDRHTVKIRPMTAASEYKGTETIGFRVALGKTIDPASISLFGEFKTGAASQFFDDWIGSVIKTVTVKLNGQAIAERIDNYNRVRNVLGNCSISEAYKRRGGDWEGYWKTANDADLGVPEVDGNLALSPRFADDGKTARPKTSFITELAEMKTDGQRGRLHGIRLDLAGLLNMGKYLHLPAVGSLDIELVLASASECVNTTAAGSSTASFTVTNPYLTVDTIDMSGVYLNVLDKVLSGGGLTLDYETYNTYAHNLGTSSGTQQIRILRNFLSLKSIYFFLVPTSKVDYAHNYTHLAVKGTLTSYNVLIDGRPVTSHAINIGAESVAEMRKAIRLHGDISQDTMHNVCNATLRSAVTAANFNAGPHTTVQGVDLEKSSLISGRSASEIQIELTMSAAPDLAMTCYVVCHYDKRIVVQSGKVMTEIS
jgi:hypothetical protein